MATTPKKRLLFVLTSHDRKGDKPGGFHLAELTHPHLVLSEAGYGIDFASPRGGKAPVDPDTVRLDDPINAAFWNDAALRYAIDHTLKPSEVAADDYAAVFYPGGHATMWDLPDDAELASLAAHVYEQGGVVGAVCHGPAGLVNVKLSDGSYLVAGKDVAAFTNDEERASRFDRIVPFLLADRLRERGARHSAAPNGKARIVVSDRLVTGQNPASANGVAQAMAAVLAGKQAPTPRSSWHEIRTR